MPFKSEAQRRWMYAAESRGEVPKGTAERWERHTKGKQLPERVDSEAKKESVDLSVLQSLLEAGQHYGPMAAQHVSDFASSHPLAFGAGTGAAGYAGGRVHQALRDFGKNIARGGRAVGSGIHGAGRAVGQGLKDVSTNAALGVASAGHNVGQGMSAAGRSIGQGVSSAGKSINEANRRREISRTIGRFLKRGSLNEHDVYSGPPSFAPEDEPPVSTTEAAKNLTERRDDQRTDVRDAPSALPMLGAKEAGDEPWKKEAPAGKKKSTLTDEQKDAARRRAAEAGRPYPNLIDNMWAAGRGKKADVDDLDLGSDPSKTGAEDALILLGLPHAWAQKIAAGAWQRAEGKNPEGGLNAKGRASLKAEGHNIKPPVSSEQAKKSPKAAARRKSFCARMGGMPGPMKKDNGEPTRKALALRKWDC